MTKELAVPNYLKEEDIDRIAERAAEKAIEKVYTEIGKSVVKRVVYVIGVGALVLAFWLNGKGFFHD